MIDLVYLVCHDRLSVFGLSWSTYFHDFSRLVIYNYTYIHGI